MPMSFPNMESLKKRAAQRGFRQPNEGEAVWEYRAAFALFMKDVDRCEAAEILTGKAWNTWTEADQHDAILVMTPNTPPEAG
jgi:hypothetical protein